MARGRNAETKAFRAWIRVLSTGTPKARRRRPAHAARFPDEDEDEDEEEEEEEEEEADIPPPFRRQLLPPIVAFLAFAFVGGNLFFAGFVKVILPITVTPPTPTSIATTTAKESPVLLLPAILFLLPFHLAACPFLRPSCHFRRITVLGKEDRRV
jgi:hypothetical protein